MSELESNQLERRQRCSAPDVTTCRAMRVGKNDDMVYCLRDDAANCGYALRFGSGFFCYHPKQREIVTRTKVRSLRAVGA